MKAVVLFLSVILFHVFTAFGPVMSPARAGQAKARRPARARRGFYRFEKQPVRVYQELTLFPKLNTFDAVRIETELKEKGAASIKTNCGASMIAVQYSAGTLTSQKIRQYLKKVGYSVVAVN